MFRKVDFFLAAFGIAISMPIIVAICILGVFETGSPIFRQVRIGKDQKLFVLVKFRSMSIKTAAVATHLADPQSVTPFGRILRKTKLDEVPQLWNVLRGEMSLVGPRPCLPIQKELIAEREKLGVFEVRPGITGLAQVSGIDMSTPKLLAETDAAMIETLNLKNYFKYILLTVLGKGAGDRIRSN